MEDCKGFSWSLDKSIAKWFSTRYKRDGYVYKAQIRKEDIVGYLEHETEIIVDYTKLFNIEKM